MINQKKEVCALSISPVDKWGNTCVDVWGARQIYSEIGQENGRRLDLLSMWFDWWCLCITLSIMEDKHF